MRVKVRFNISYFEVVLKLLSIALLFSLYLFRSVSRILPSKCYISVGGIVCCLCVFAHGPSQTVLGGQFEEAFFCFILGTIFELKSCFRECKVRHVGDT
jgi:hypothetical protein